MVPDLRKEIMSPFKGTGTWSPTSVRGKCHPGIRKRVSQLLIDISGNEEEPLLLYT
jgi:hypothetical protein